MEGTDDVMTWGLAIREYSYQEACGVLHYLRIGPEHYLARPEKADGAALHDELSRRLRKSHRQPNGMRCNRCIRLGCTASRADGEGFIRAG